MKSKGKRTLTSRPRTVDVLLVVATTIHAFLALSGIIPNIWDGLNIPEQPERAEALYTGALGTAAIVSGFSGVVVVFALTAPGRRFRDLRALGGVTLKANWMSATASGFWAVLAFTSATLSSLLGHPSVAPYFFQAGLLILAHSSIRLVWLLGHLTDIVVAEDKEQIRKEQEPKSAKELLRSHHR